MHRLRCLWRCRLTGADRPHGFVSKRHLPEVTLCKSVKCINRLRNHHRVGLSLAALVKGFSNAEDHFKPGRKRFFHFFGYHLIGVAEKASAFAVTDKRHTRTDVSDHSRRDFARVGAGVKAAHVLSRGFHGAVFEKSGEFRQIHKGRRHRHVTGEPRRKAQEIANPGGVCCS